MKHPFQKRLLTLLTAAAMMLVLAVPALAALDTSTLPDNVVATAYKDGEFSDLSMADDAIDHNVVGSVAVNPNNSSLVDITIPVKPHNEGIFTGYITGLTVPAFGTLGTDYTVTVTPDPYPSGGELVITVNPSALYASDDDTGAARLYDVTFDVGIYWENIFTGEHTLLGGMPAEADLEIDVQVTP